MLVMSGKLLDPFRVEGRDVGDKVRIAFENVDGLEESLGGGGVIETEADPADGSLGAGSGRSSDIALTRLKFLPGPGRRFEGIGGRLVVVNGKIIVGKADDTLTGISIAGKDEANQTSGRSGGVDFAGAQVLTKQIHLDKFSFGEARRRHKIPGGSAQETDLGATGFEILGQ